MTAILLAALAAALMGPVPAYLSRSKWPARAPRAAIILWQAIGLTTGLALIGSLLEVGLAPFGSDLSTMARLVHGDLVSGRPLPPLDPGNIAALLAAGLVTLWLASHTVATAWIMERRRRHHRKTIDLLTQRYLPDGSQVVADTRPLAYSLPGRDWRVVVSEGALELLGERELAAVLAHERAHLRSRHDLVLLPFAALVRAFPLPTLRAARSSVASLVEMVADDHAAASCGRSATAAALRRMRPSLQPAPDWCPPLGRGTSGRAELRLARLTSGTSLASPLLGSLMCAAAALLLVAPAVAVV